MLRSKSDRVFMVIIYCFVGLFAFACLYPLLLTLMTSITDEQTLIRDGYKMFPQKYSLAAYQVIVDSMGSKVFNAYKITIFVTVVGTALSLFVTASIGYVVSVKDFKQRNIINMLLYIPMVFSAGLLPWYIVCTKYYHLTNTMWALILPPCLNVFNVFLMRNFFNSLPTAVFESAKIDGAGHFRIFFQIAIPMAQVGIYTVGMLYALGYWNDYYNALMFIRKSEMYPMQYYLYNILSNIQFAARQSQNRLSYNIAIPSETIKMAIIIVTILPILFLYPFIQRYIVKGVVVGAVKG
ncbi:MAG: carbohydrate ABC transporter permease [Clostridia bacterium]|nr:carbohydrate ABC transporter permease [Clostridia bacterium]